MHIRLILCPCRGAFHPFLILLRGRRAGVAALADHCRHRLVHDLRWCPAAGRAAGGITNHAGVHVSPIRYISVHHVRAVAAVVSIYASEKYQRSPVNPYAACRSDDNRPHAARSPRSCKVVTAIQTTTINCRTRTSAPRLRVAARLPHQPVRAINEPLLPWWLQ